MDKWKLYEEARQKDLEKFKVVNFILIDYTPPLTSEEVWNLLKSLPPYFTK